MAELREGQTGVAQDGTRVIVRAGQIVPVGPVDVSSEWGSGARQLPNGTIERVGPRGGVTKLSSAATNGGGGGEAMVGADARARFMLGLGPLKSAQANLADLERDGNPVNQNWGAALLDQATEVPFLRNIGDSAARMWGGDDYGRYTQAAASYESALLPIMSGAAVTPSEAQRIIRADLPQLGDSPEVLRRKADNRAMRINGVAKGIGEEAPFLPAVADGRDGLPSYPSIERLTRDAEDFPAPDGGYGPRPGDVSTTVQPLAPEDTPTSLAAQGYVYDAARDTWSRSRQVQVPGADRQDFTPAGAVADRRDDWGVFRRPDAFMRGMADTTSMEFADEAGGFANAAIGRGNGDGFDERLRNNIQVERAIDAADGADMPMTRRAGQIAGAVVSLPRILPKLLSRGLFNVGRNALAGGAMAAATAAGDTEGGAGERAQNALTAAPLGALVGTAAGPAVRAFGRAASPAIDTARGLFGSAANAAVRAAGRRGWEAIEASPLSRGLDHFAGTNRPDIQQMTARAAALQEATGRPATLIDTMNTGGRGLMRGVALRGDNARQLSEDFAAGRTEALPARISEQVRARVSGDLRTAQQITEETTQRRSALAREDYAEPYAAPVVVDDATVSALQGPTGRTAIQKARSDAEVWRQPEVVDDLNRLEEWAQAGFQGPRPQISAAALDGVHQAMTGRARRLTQNPNTNRAGAGLFNRAEDVDGALDNVPGLEAARGNYRELSGQIEAAETGSRFMGGNPDRVAAELQGLSPDQMNVARATAARSIENAAGTTGSAPSVARRLYIPNTPQYQASEALLGQEGANGLAAGLRGEADLVRNAQRTSPSYGSNTNMDQQDTERATQGALGALGAAGRGRPLEAISKLMDGLRSRGFNDDQAEAFIRAAQDDSQTAYLISELSRRMTDREAVDLVRATRYAVSGGIGRGNGD